MKLTTGMFFAGALAFSPLVGAQDIPQQPVAPKTPEQLQQQLPQPMQQTPQKNLDKMKDEASAEKIRRSIQSDTTLSAAAQAVKVNIAEDGMVTLIGKVPTELERSKVESKAAKVVGASKVNSQLEVQK